MIKYTREELKKHLPELITLIQKNHVMEDNIERELFIENKPVVGLCHSRGYFVIMDEWFIQYGMEHIITDVNLRLIGRRLTDVTFYDDFQEYESARVKQMSKSKDQTGLNFN